MEAALLECEQGETGAEAVNSIFRAAHTIKGSSGLFGLDGIVAFTHVVESVLDRVRANTLQMDRTLAAILLECRDHIEHLVDAVADGKPDDVQLATKGASLLQKLSARAGGSAARACNCADCCCCAGRRPGRALADHGAVSCRGPAQWHGPAVVHPVPRHARRNRRADSC